jgi:DNA-binding NarL/FixJ family response regulator
MRSKSAVGGFYRDPRRRRLGCVLRVLLIVRLRTFGDVVARALEEDPALQVLVSVPTGVVHPAVLSYGHPDVAVVSCDVARDLAAGLAPAQRWTGVPRVVILADLDDAGDATELFRRGAAGWVERVSSISELGQTIHAAGRGETRMPPQLLTRVMTELAERPSWSDGRHERVARLTDREEQIMRMIAHGMGRREIAAQLHLSPNTVRTHVQSILNRLEVHSTLAAVALVRSVAGDRAVTSHHEPPPLADVDANTSIDRCAPSSPRGSLGRDLAASQLLRTTEAGARRSGAGYRESL